MSRRAATCERCGHRFGCAVAAGSCWCQELELSAADARRLALVHGDCLCPDCLGEVAGSDGAPEAATGGHGAGLTPSPPADWPSR